LINRLIKNFRLNALIIIVVCQNVAFSDFRHSSCSSSSSKNRRWESGSVAVGLW